MNNELNRNYVEEFFMKVIVEIENEEDYDINLEKLKKIKKILNKDLEIRKNIKSRKKNFSDKIEDLSWNMGGKKYRKREELYER